MRVTFFMRKGAECLSKWIGESERQLRLLFEQVRLKCAICSVWVGIKFLWSTTCSVSSFHCHCFLFQWSFRGLKSWDVLGKVSKGNKKILESTTTTTSPLQKKNQKPKTQTQQPPKKSQKMFQEVRGRGLRSEGERCRIKAWSFKLVTEGCFQNLQLS